MMFLCLGYFEPEKMDSRPKAEIDAVMDECGPYLEKLYRSGRVLMDAGLDVEAKSLQRENGSVTVSDGPFTKAKALVGSAFLIEAENMEEAIRIALLHPTAQLAAGEQFGWGIEIRPVNYIKEKE
ncbi:YciI family protein [Bacillus sp. FJAT-27445]|uniref:YciI family protein n=1 Tax=Bacillus sp. FJAT-27445 TaxID=1679166 RepID=UPI0007441B17|nr:YciI family protein [Bacillus sp. FJAT-27445]